MFGEMSIHSIKDLFVTIKEDSLFSNSLLLKELWDELEKQDYLQQVVFLQIFLRSICLMVAPGCK
jgi:hypothetical protein